MVRVPAKEKSNIMDKIALNAQPRPAGDPTKMRKQNLIPAIVYGHNVPTEHLALAYPEFEKVFRKAGESTLVELVTNGQARNVIIQDTQRHYLTNKFLHVDFYAVSMTEKLKATVALEFIGSSPAVKEGNVLVTVISEIEVECLPADLPHNIEVDISVLDKVDASIHVRDLKIDGKVEVLTDLDEVVAKINAPRDVEAELAQPIVEDVSQVEGAAENKPEAVEGAEAPVKKE